MWGEVELAWRLRDPARPAPWLAVTGTNGKTTTVQMLEAMLRAGGLRTVACGNVGLPIVEAVMDPEPYDVLAVELSSFQLHYTSSMKAESAAVLNVAEDHLDWYAGPDGGPEDAMDAYARDKGRIYAGVERACVYNVSDPVTEQLVRDAEVQEGARAIGFTLGTPSVGMVGLVDDVLADRAFIEDRANAAAELCTLSDLATSAPHYVANALAAAALARSHGVSTGAVQQALREFRPDGHRIAEVGVIEDVTWIDDSKATNPHAALASLQAYDPVVWVAGGLAKGARFDELVQRVRDRLRGVVLLGRDAPVIRESLSRHAPDVPVIEVECRRDCRGRTHGPRRRSCGDVGSARRHGSPGPGMRLHGHVRQLRRTRRRLRRGRAPDAAHAVVDVGVSTRGIWEAAVTVTSQTPDQGEAAPGLGLRDGCRPPSPRCGPAWSDR